MARTHDEQLEVCKLRFDHGDKQFDEIWKKLNEIHKDVIETKVDVAGYKGRVVILASIISAALSGVIAFFFTRQKGA